ncbi:dihydropteroate synthase [Herpetosiphon giganteus]|uniref:dihydropteroate synthase n=1 Tax=Herpetosiphon giganteus TaxID=2029754 RepID=UPI00195DBF23|nr:dihydropteroate synthase [Herpetosiphon giganteus]MBM7846244.1 dihydropteroate synthase [Herpetosiphon giganteus]
MPEFAYNIRQYYPQQRAELLQVIAQIETYPNAAERVLTKANLIMLHCDQVDPHTAMIVKQELLALDGDALVSPHVYLGQSSNPTKLLAWANERSWRALCAKFQAIPLPALQALAQQIGALLVHNQARGSLKLGSTQWHWGQKTLVMGIVNVTPDSFSNDGLLEAGQSQIQQQALDFAAAGADMLDIGGESTRPGASIVSIEQEIARVVPAIQAIRQVCQLPISIDSYKAEVVAAALAAGANVVNDIWGLRQADGSWNTALAQVVAQAQVPIILMHNRVSTVEQFAHGTNYAASDYGDIIGEVCAELRQSIDFALQSGIANDLILLDPGIGFGKSPEQNLQVLRQLRTIASLGYPLLVGTSRKSMIGITLNRPVEQRLWGTAATVAYAIQAGADIVRVHDVAAMVDVCRMTDALVRHEG